MSMHPSIAAAIADQHRRDLITQADACRLARTAHQSRSGRPVSGVRAISRVVTTAAVACTTAVLLMLAPAGHAHHSAHSWSKWTLTAAGQSHYVHQQWS